MISMEQRFISSDRVLDISGIDATHLECVICQNILWKPVACQSCETAFCSSCINRWLANNPNKCPKRCKSYIERKCPPFILKLLAQLKFTCFYELEGCEQIISYEALEKHQQECGYQPRQCPSCRSNILKKDFENHQTICPFVELTCEDCELVYKRHETSTKHTENMCLKEQVYQLRDESKEKERLIQKLTEQLNEIIIWKTRMNQEVTIDFDDLPSAEQRTTRISNIYRQLKWTGIDYGHESYLTEKYPKSGYITSFIPEGSSHVAYFSKKASISAEQPNETFTLLSLTACAAWNDDLQLTITGYRNSMATNIHTAILLFGKPQTIVLQWKDIDEVIFVPSGGTGHSRIFGSKGLHVVITQLKMSFNMIKKQN